MSGIIAHLFRKNCLLLAGAILFALSNAEGATKTSAQSGNWTTASTWSPSGVPANSDNVIIANGHTVTIDNNKTIQNITVNSGGILLWNAGKRITINGNFTVNGTATMNKGEITLSSPGLAFTLGPSSFFTWDPGTNNSTNATLFTRGAESFSSTSTLIIKNWYNYTLSLGSVITGNFGNLIMNSPGGSSSIVEWNQNNQFETHQILGTLTIDQGWITLDKSGSISSTSIGNIVLTSVNSAFYGHSGTHLGSFSITTGSVTNNGGIFYGLNNGNGNVTINVNGNFTNIGNVKIINNGGVLAVGNGNATFNVSGTYLQSTGDTRIIYNVTTLLSGTFTSTINALSLTGGIFMGQTGCHILGSTSSLTITNNCTINFSSAADKFRCTSLSSIGVVLNNAKVNFTVGGNLVFSGPGAAEFTSSASAGIETIQIGGNLQINSGVFSMNYGTSAASHDLTLTITGDLIVNGGTSYLSRNSGTSVITIGGNISIASGILAVKGSSGSCTFNLTGNFLQNGGTFYLHSNGTTFTPNPITLNISGTFAQSAGTFSFDDNTSNSSAVHILNILGSQYSISGTGIITHAGSGSSTVFGLLRFSGSGTQVYSRTGNTHALTQVKIEIGSNVQIGTGNLLIASGNSAGTDYLKIVTGGKIDLGLNQIISEASFSNCGIQVDSGGTLSTESSYGLYDGTSFASLASTGNMDYFLHASGVIEYTGNGNQILTGTGNGIATSINHQYGILKINKSNTAYAEPVLSNVIVRTQLQMESGELRLNGNTLTISNGNNSGITRNNGYIFSESDASSLVWKDMSGGMHVIPLGLNSTTYIPVSITPTSGFPSDVQISTRGTAADNKPYPTVAAAATSINLLMNGRDGSTDAVIDRWWNFSAPGLTANVTLSYPGTENTLSPELSAGMLSMMSWNGSSWSSPRGSGLGVNSGVGTLTINNATQFSHWIIASNSAALPIELAYFTANVTGKEVLLSWATATETNNSFFNIERGTDGISYESIQQINGAGNSTSFLTYGVTDKNPIEGTSYYRLKQTDFDGKYSYSNVEVINYTSSLANKILINSIGPNPFKDNFTIHFATEAEQDVEFQLLSSTGQMLENKKIRTHDGMNQYEYTNGQNLENGVYFIQLICQDQKLSRKMVKN